MLLALTFASLLQAAPAADTIPGSWRFQGDIAGFPLDQVCTFEQEETALSGNCITGEGASIPLTGEVKEGNITFQHGGEYEGEPLTIIYTGTLATPEEFKGTILVRPFEVTGYFAAAPVPSEQPEQ
jgi:hypothetical protein